jgi:hypothetical protein
MDRFSKRTLGGDGNIERITDRHNGIRLHLNFEIGQVNSLRPLVTDKKKCSRQEKKRTVSLQLSCQCYLSG